jgi:hypothetical protein
MNCDCCKEKISERYAINITIRINPDSDDCHALNFCDWDCAATWFNARAGDSAALSWLWQNTV